MLFSAISLKDNHIVENLDISDASDFELVFLSKIQRGKRLKAFTVKRSDGFETEAADLLYETAFRTKLTLRTHLACNLIANNRNVTR